MAHLSYGLSQGGCFIVLTGEVGTGKTTLCRNLLNDLPENVDVALILNANVNETELLQTVCDELKIQYQESLSQKQLLDLINNHLLKTFSENRHTVLIIDEAQLLKRDVLEQIRLLTNLETTKSKLLQIILIGQPELYGLLSRNDLRQLAQRVTARYHLGALQRNEIEEYVNYRLSVAGCKQPLFSRQALNKMHDLSGGIPRKINVLADHALLSTYSQNKRVVDSPIVSKAAKEVFIVAKPIMTDKQSMVYGYAKWAVIVMLLLLINVAGWYYFNGQAAESEENKSEVVNDAIVEQINSQVANDSQLLDADEQPEQRGIKQNVGNAAALDDSTEIQLVSAVEAISVEPVSTFTGESSVTPGTVVISETDLTIDPDVDTVLDFAAADKSLNLDVGKSKKFELILESSADLTGRIVAFRGLAKLWGLELPSKIIKPVCQAAADQGLSCLSLKKWSNLQSFNRPTILVVEHNGKAHRVIIESIEGDVANVLIADSVEQVALSELRTRWTGAGVIFWRSKSPSGPFLKLGDNDVSVLAARRKLNKALNKVALPELINIDSTAFDRDMLQKTIELQQFFGIESDGQIGSGTHLLLNELANSDSTPVLTQRVNGSVL